MVVQLQERYSNSQICTFRRTRTATMTAQRTATALVWPTSVARSKSITILLRGWKQAIRVVQFEFGMCNIETKFLLKDFWQFFSDRGFLVGAVMPKGVRFKEYNHRDEDFQGPPNFLAVQSSQMKL